MRKKKFYLSASNKRELLQTSYLSVSSRSSLNLLKQPASIHLRNNSWNIQGTVLLMSGRGLAFWGWEKLFGSPICKNRQGWELGTLHKVEQTHCSPSSLFPVPQRKLSNCIFPKRVLLHLNALGPLFILYLPSEGQTSLPTSRIETSP